MKKFCPHCGKEVKVDEHLRKHIEHVSISHFKCAFASTKEVRDRLIRDGVIKNEVR